MGGNCALPRGSLRCPQKPPRQIHSPGKQSIAMNQNLLFLGVSETPKTNPQGGSIKVAMPDSIRVASDRPRANQRVWQRIIILLLGTILTYHGANKELKSRRMTPLAHTPSVTATFAFTTILAPWRSVGRGSGHVKEKELGKGCHVPRKNVQGARGALNQFCSYRFWVNLPNFGHTTFG